MNGDIQVKLRGQRFELREVEAAMLAAGKGDILEAVSHTRYRDQRDNASAYLVAHVVLAQEIQKKYGTNGPVIDSMLRNIISNLAFPQYMCPSVVVSLPSMPLNHHGKVDRTFLSKSPLRGAAEPVKVVSHSAQDQRIQFQHEIEHIGRSHCQSDTGRKLRLLPRRW